MLRLTDTHCHLNLNSFEDDLPDVLIRARGAGVRRILVPGIDLETSRKAVEIACQYPEVYAAVGVHPNYALIWTAETEAEFRKLANEPKVVAIGEIGLDYYRDHTPRQVQLAVLIEQLALAKDLHLPVVLHNRSAFDDLWRYIKEWAESLDNSLTNLATRPGVFHSFDGSLQQAHQVTERGFFVGLSGPVTYKNAPAHKEIAAGIDVHKIIIETDAPFLTPSPYRGKRNEPAYTRFICKKISELKELDTETLAEITADNATRLFAWEP